MKAEVQSKPREKIQNLMHGLMQNAGILKMENPWKQTFTHLASVCLISCVSMMFVVIYLSRNNAEKIFEILSVLTFSGMSTLKLKCMRQNSDIWKYLIKDITTLEKQQLPIENTRAKEYETDDEETELALASFHIKKYTQRCQTILRLIQTFYRFTLVIYITAPFIEYFFRKIVVSETVELPYILPGWSFLSDMGKLGYIFAVFIQAIASFYCVIIHLSFDMITVSFMMFASGQFNLLRVNSERIGGAGKHILQYNQRDDRAHERIKKCHQIHIRLINFTTKVSNLLKDILGIYFFVAGMTLCSIAYRLKTEQIGIMQTASLLQYMCGNLIQLFMFCYYGGDMFDQSAIGMGEGPFASLYWCLGTKVRKELVLLGAGMMRPRRISAGPFNHLDLSSFIQIVRAAYSYYAVLRK